MIGEAEKKTKYSKQTRKIKTEIKLSGQESVISI